MSRNIPPRQDSACIVTLAEARVIIIITIHRVACILLPNHRRPPTEDPMPTRAGQHRPRQQRGPSHLLRSSGRRCLLLEKAVSRSPRWLLFKAIPRISLPPPLVLLSPARRVLIQHRRPKTSEKLFERTNQPQALRHDTYFQPHDHCYESCRPRSAP